jgi:hypothetical protein
LVPGVHAAAQAPLEHTAGQPMVSCQVPVESHVWTSLPLQRTACATQLPVHAPAEHRKGHACALPQLPVASQV